MLEQSTWRGEAAYAHMAVTLAGDCHPVPPVPGNLRPKLPVNDGWGWGTIPFSREDHYYYPKHLKWLLKDWDREPLFEFSHGGYGTNSWGFSLTVSRGPVVLYVTTPWGGFYHDPVENVQVAGAMYHRIWKLLDLLPEDGPVVRLVLPWGHQGPRIVDLEPASEALADDVEEIVLDNLNPWSEEFESVEAALDAVGVPGP